jgi:hypothetical protein
MQQFFGLSRYSAIVRQNPLGTKNGIAYLLMLKPGEID